jgi:hypothetical protein
MSNVVYLNKPTEADRPPEPEPSAEPLSTLPAITSEIRRRLAEVKEDVRVTLLMLDLAAAHARRFSETTDDLQIRKQVEDHLAAMQELLEVARQKANAL